MFKILKVNSLPEGKQPSARVNPLFEEISITDSIDVARNTISFLNGAYLRGLIDRTIGFVIYDTRTPLVTITGTDSIGEEVSNTDYSYVPLEVARLACNNWNDNHPANSYATGSVNKYSYFYPNVTGKSVTDV